MCFIHNNDCIWVPIRCTDKILWSWNGWILSELYGTSTNTTNTSTITTTITTTCKYNRTNRWHLHAWPKSYGFQLFGCGWRKKYYRSDSTTLHGWCKFYIDYKIFLPSSFVTYFLFIHKHSAQHSLKHWLASLFWFKLSLSFFLPFLWRSLKTFLFMWYHHHWEQVKHTKNLFSFSPQWFLYFYP